LIYDADSVLDRNEIEVWVRSFNSAIETARDEVDDFDLYMQHLFVLFCVLSLNVLKTNNVTGTSKLPLRNCLKLVPLRREKRFQTRAIINQKVKNESQ
jgi:hypothetical protein